MPSDGNNRYRGGTRREDSFLARWSRRKHEAEHGPPAEEAEPEADSAEASIDTDVHAPAAETADEDTTTAVEDTESADADLPHPDTLDRNSDFSVYLKRRVSSAFRRAAMRRLFSSPEFNVRDGLDDYDEDYTQFQSLGDTVTAHMRHHEERLRQRDQEKAEQAERDAETEAERERVAARDEPERTPDDDADAAPATDEQQTGTVDDPTPADDAPESTDTARTATNRDSDDTT
ncbi:MAG: DUF3306 domain-containing protein [Halofilum sp. (in: g-proteobacteria)]|nr:DUF3306 domain-containing protein [Halofilum sp. (in: g-proteobacteria)]